MGRSRGRKRPASINKETIMHEDRRNTLARDGTSAKQTTHGVKKSKLPEYYRFRHTEERQEEALLPIIRCVRDYLWYRAQVFNFQQLELTGQATPDDNSVAAMQIDNLRCTAVRLDKLLCNALFEVAVPPDTDSRFLLCSRRRGAVHLWYRLEQIEQIREDTQPPLGPHAFCGEHSICGVRLFDHDAKYLSAWIEIVVATYGKRAREEGLELDRLPIDRQLAAECSGRNFEDLMNSI